ncbi:hypothetical protein KAR91_52125 [Candidatus Pacearchaeota archaeon]|nr:hypothetical protein [Candidatus Pacearchaeota archaeon]
MCLFAAQALNVPPILDEHLELGIIGLNQSVRVSLIPYPLLNILQRPKIKIDRGSHGVVADAKAVAMLYKQQADMA